MSYFKRFEDYITESTINEKISTNKDKASYAEEAYMPAFTAMKFKVKKLEAESSNKFYGFGNGEITASFTTNAGKDYFMKSIVNISPSSDEAVDASFEISIWEVYDGQKESLPFIMTRKSEFLEEVDEIYNWIEELLLQRIFKSVRYRAVFK